jgi:hypothetical protein
MNRYERYLAEKGLDEQPPAQASDKGIGLYGIEATDYAWWFDAGTYIPAASQPLTIRGIHNVLQNLRRRGSR